MKKIFVIVLACVIFGLLSAGCVDVAPPPGFDPNTPSTPDPSNPDPSNPDPSNPDPSTPTDPDDPMYPGVPGTNYITRWAGGFSTTTSPQKYVGATYDSSNTADVAKTVKGKDTSPNKTSFTNDTVCYSIVDFPDVTYNSTNAADCKFVGNAPDGFVVADYEYNSTKNEINYKEESKLVDSTGDKKGKYTTVVTAVLFRVEYKTEQPILRASYIKSISGENYYGLCTTVAYNSEYDYRNYPFATIWDDDTVTFSAVPFADVSYEGETSSEYSTDDVERTWRVGTALPGRKESDHTYDEGADWYKYDISASGASANQSDEDLQGLLEDAEDVIGDILDNDGRPTEQPQP